MSSSDTSSGPPAFSIRAFLQTAQSRPWLLYVPTLACAALAVLYVLFGPVTWEAYQAVVVRDEVAAGGKPGKFMRVEDMKTLQETLLELAMSRSVLRDTLLAVGPPASASGSEWPTERAIDDLQSAVKLAPPKGAEFGKTEVFYIRVQDSHRDRAVALTGAMSHELIDRYQHLRGRKAQGIVSELEKTVDLAQREMQTATTQLGEIEHQAGRDLPDLRMLNELPSGESKLSKSFVEVQAELRTQQPVLQQNEQLLELLRNSAEHPQVIVASPARLLESQPGLKKLKDSLVDAQVKTSTLLGSLTPEHPSVIAARNAEVEIALQIRRETQVAATGVALDLTLVKEKIASLEKQRADMQTRFERLADIRATYGNLVTVVKNRNEILRACELELAEARSTLAAADTASVLTVVDKPDTGSRPQGLGRTITVLSATLAGLIAGFGLLFLVSPTDVAKPSLRELFEQSPLSAAAAQTLPVSTSQVVEVPLPSTNAPWPTIEPFATPHGTSDMTVGLKDVPTTGPLNTTQALAKIFVANPWS
jgi:uncharacterized protein involved in exopolysaccharide biosynthesis